MLLNEILQNKNKTRSQWPFTKSIYIAMLKKKFIQIIYVIRKYFHNLKKEEISAFELLRIEYSV
jgi:hypothetical protein